MTIIPVLQPIRIPVLIVCDGYADDLFSFSAAPDKTDNYFTLTQFVTTLRNYDNTPYTPIFMTRFEVTLAHRDNDQGVAGGPLLDNTVINACFTWHGEPAVPTGKNGVELSDYQVIFMFGFSEDLGSSLNGSTIALTNLCWDGGVNEDQVWAFTQFMQAGGGIFATGDHEDRGAALCGSIPRVRSMRRWWWDTANQYNTGTPLPGVAPPADPEEGPFGTWDYGVSYVFSVEVTHSCNRSPYQNLGDLCAPPALGPYRIDTIQMGPNGYEEVPDYWLNGANYKGVPFDRQSDDIPQPMRVTVQHPVLALAGNQYLSFMPDHMHEGLVIGSGDLDQWTNANLTQTFEHNGQSVTEYPTISGGTQPLPQVIAQLRSTTHSTPGGDLKTASGTNLAGGQQHIGALDAPYAELFHGAISVYDGHQANVGRVVTQTSFHHFLDINLLGDPATQVSGGTNRLGFTTTAGQPYMSQFEQYWYNLIFWLTPVTAKPAMMRAALQTARRNSTIRMAASRPEMQNNGYAVHDVGQMAVQHLDARWPAPMLHDIMHACLAAEHRTKIQQALTHRRRAVPHLIAPIRRSMLHGFMGGALLHVLHADDASAADSRSGALHPALLSAGLRGAARSLSVSPHHAVVPDVIAALRRFADQPVP